MTFRAKELEMQQNPEVYKSQHQVRAGAQSQGAREIGVPEGFDTTSPAWQLGTRSLHNFHERDIVREPPIQHVEG